MLCYRRTSRVLPALEAIVHSDIFLNIISLCTTEDVQFNLGNLKELHNIISAFLALENVIMKRPYWILLYFDEAHTHSVTFTLIQSQIQTITHWQKHSLKDILIHLLTQTFTHWHNHSHSHSLIHLLSHSLSRSLPCWSHSLTRSLMSVFILFSSSHSKTFCSTGSRH